MSALIECRDVSLRYENRTVLQGLRFTVEANDYLCVLGENGSGKSTLIKALLDLKHVSSGEIVFGGGLKRTEIGYLPQQTAVQHDFPASVWEVVLSGCLNRRGWRPYYNANDRRRAQDALDTLDMASMRRRAFGALSGGQRQRVLLARALCAAGGLLLLDEPEAGLDPVATAQFYAAIEALHARGMAIVMVSHDVRRAVKDATHVLHLAHRPLFFGTAADYAASDVGRRFLGGASDD